VHDFDDESNQFVEFLPVAFVRMSTTITSNLYILLRRGSNELDSSSSTDRSSPVILSASEESQALGNEILRWRSE